MFAAAAEGGSATAAHNLAWALQHSAGLAHVPQRHAFAYKLLLRGAELDGFADGLVDAALLAFHGDRCLLQCFVVLMPRCWRQLH